MEIISKIIQDKILMNVESSRISVAKIYIHQGKFISLAYFTNFF